ncbi:MAG: hypothetical protein IJ946_03200 [Clostridia bacterium]|nr:hypothetical protein [Clostridia bacterium]
MLKKCFKYDFKSVFKIWWIAAVTVLGLSVPAGIAYESLREHFKDPARRFIWENSAVGAFWFSVMAILILTSVLVAVRFYINFFSDEGYLTFTLPVKRSTLLFSKILSGFVFYALTALVVVVSLAVIGLFVPAVGESYSCLTAEVLCEFILIFKEVPLKDILWIIAYALELVLMAILSPLVSTLFLYTLITLGATIAKRHKVAATIGLMVGSNYLLSALIIPVVLAIGLWVNATLHLFSDKMLGEYDWMYFVLFAFLFVIAVLATVCAFLGNVIQGCLERKLNLP